MSYHVTRSFPPVVQAVDQRGSTPLLAAYKNGHFEVVEWLLAHVAHLPSEPECNKAFLAPMPADTDITTQRTKCIELIMKVCLRGQGRERLCKVGERGERGALIKGGNWKGVVRGR